MVSFINEKSHILYDTEAEEKVNNLKTTLTYVGHRL